jgi:hypothetical protein
MGLFSSPIHTVSNSLIFPTFSVSSIPCFSLSYARFRQASARYVQAFPPSFFVPLFQSFNRKVHPENAPGKIMPKKSNTLSGFYQDQDVIQLKNKTQGNVSQHMGGVLSYIPYGTGLEITLTYEDVDYLHGLTGVVWATYDQRQAETIKAALLAQSIACEVREQALQGAQLYLLFISEAHEVAAAVDFIWREPSGLCLQPDWWYPAGAENASFKKWIDGT